MRVSGLLNRSQVEEIHRNALRVLEEVGIQVEHEGLRKRLSSIGGYMDTASERVRFPAKTVDSLIRDAPKTEPKVGNPTISLGCNVYQSFYLDPHKNKLQPFDEETLPRYYGLARSLPLVDHLGILGVPFLPEGIPAKYLPLAEKLYAWRYGIPAGNSVHYLELCEPILEMFRIHASATGKPLEEIFNAGGFMVSPLRLARPECEQITFFAERGLRMWIGHLPSLAGTAPVTFAGTIVLSLAEQMFMFLLNEALWGDASFGVWGMASVLDMKTGVSCYGRPERHKINLAFGDIAAFYGCGCSGHTGTTDAHLPSYEVGVHKTQGVLATALATGHAFIEGGLLGTDEICSPVQLVLDHDLAGSLKSMLAEPVVDEGECAFEEILKAGTEGNHLGTPFTAERFRESLFFPMTWSNELISAWRASGSKTDVDKAMDVISDFESRFVPQTFISEEEDRELRKVIDKAVQNRLV